MNTLVKILLISLLLIGCTPAQPKGKAVVVKADGNKIEMSCEEINVYGGNSKGYYLVVRGGGASYKVFLEEVKSLSWENVDGE